jgi:rhomboid protease GluP
MFLHGGMTHILLNMISLYIVGRIAEELFSRGDYLLLYWVTGIVGAGVSVAMHPEGLSVGASGAIFGIFGAIAGYALAHRHALGDRFRRFMREFGTVLVLNLILGFSIPGIDMSAHIGGLIVGFVGGYVARYRYAIWIGSGVLLAGVWSYLVFYLPGLFATQGLIG